MSKVVVMTFSAGHETVLTAWRTHAARVLGTDIPRGHESPIGRSVWQLVSDNHRVLARRIAVFESVDDALADARSGLAAPDQYRAAMVHDRATRSLGWYLRLDDEPSVVSARWYATERDRRSSLALASAALQDAELGQETRVARVIPTRRGR